MATLLRSAELTGTLQLLDLTAPAAARLLEIDLPRLHRILSGDERLPDDLHEVIEAIGRFTDAVVAGMATQKRVRVYTDDRAFIRALPRYAGYTASWHRTAAARAAVRNPDLEVTFG
ncbi:hypothetical protein ATK17_1020 [Branchiibius hedensis]|uniref:Uncharacterized protein n=1 Tax=Branchiibius hedensis TaxID=672460 RepID=A0A2Y9C150_9MICO|nr:hypothetical protein [Branchiibius hedensis]PWJ24917.1 hypothetical protein ATK17_1020 [Branchiibius hedensis]SSA33733.1 hypothetical protein SAMN04489750_1020 [Branchiibius hedensis]